MNVSTTTSTTRTVLCAYPRCENPFKSIEVPETLFTGEKIAQEHRGTYQGSFYVTAWGDVACCYECFREMTLFR